MSNCFLGFDGGASKSEAAILCSNGRVMAFTASGPVTLHEPVSRESLETLKKLVQETCAEAGIEAGELVASGFGVSGIDFPDREDDQHRLIAETCGLPKNRSFVMNDGVAALWGGSLEPRAMIVQVGSAYTAAYRLDFGKEVAFDHHNLGQYVDLRREIVTTAFRALEGREPGTPILDLVMRHFGTTDPDTLRKMATTRDYDKQTALRVVDVLEPALKEGDFLARRLVVNAAMEYAEDISCMLEKMGGGIAEAVLGGGLLLNGPMLLAHEIEYHVKKTHPGLIIRRPVAQPCIGAAVMAAFNSGHDVRALLSSLDYARVNKQE
ncbi:MAG: hypothetical protein GXP49_17205 [Deltaproteobacteria bacterium]|nr:hypothetical protein [Deltaproteobacteria bacterium]